LSLEENDFMTALQLGIMIVLAVITGGVRQQTTSEGAATLQGTKWQLVIFQGGDDRTLTPDDPAKYTIEFAAGGGIYEFAPLASAR
jgi:hypothetical protein